MFSCLLILIQLASHLLKFKLSVRMETEADLSDFKQGTDVGISETAYGG